MFLLPLPAFLKASILGLLILDQGGLEGQGVKAARPVASNGRAMFAFLTGWFPGLNFLGYQRDSAASPIGFLEHTERAKVKVK